MEITEEVEARLRGIAEKYNKDLTEVSELFEEKMSESLDSFVGDIDDLEDYGLDKTQFTNAAVKSVESEYNAQQRMGGGGEEVEILAYGNGGIRRWNDRDHPDFIEFDVSPYTNYEEWNDDMPKKQVLMGYGVANVLGSDEPPAKASVIIDETNGLDVHEWKDLFINLNTFTATLNVQDTETLSEGYVLWSTEDTDYERSVSEIPDDDKSKRGILNKKAELVKLTNITNSLSLTNEDGYAADRGLDIKRVRGMVFDAYKDTEAENPFAVYTLHDDSHGDVSDLEGTVLGEEDENRSAGLTCWVSPEMMEFGQGSFCDFYGTVQRNERGEYSMNCYGISPIINKPYEGVGQDESNVEEEMIE